MPDRGGYRGPPVQGLFIVAIGRSSAINDWPESRAARERPPLRVI